MVSENDGLISIAILAFFGILIYLYLNGKSEEVRFVESYEEEEGLDLLRLERQTKAREMLEAAGYRILGQNRRVRCDMMLNKKVWDEDLVADFTVLQDGAYFVCKMRSEDQEQLPNGSELRDELLPLQMLHRASGCLYLDVDKEKIHVVSFGLYDRKGLILRWRKRLTWIAAGFLLAVLLR